MPVLDRGAQVRVAEHPGGERGVDEPGRHAVDPDRRRVLERRVHRERDHARLRRGVRPLEAGRPDARHRRVVHDAAAGLAHQRHRGADAVEGPGEVDADDLRPRAVGVLVQRTGGADAGVVEQDRDPAERLGGGGDRGGARVGVGDVGDEAPTPSTSAATAARAVLVDVDDRDRGAFLVHPAGGGGADARRAAGDDARADRRADPCGRSYGAARVPATGARTRNGRRPRPPSRARRCSRPLPSGAVCRLLAGEHRVLERLQGRDAGLLRSLDLDLLPGGRVAADTRGALDPGELGEARDRDRLPLRDGLGDDLGERREKGVRRLLLGSGLSASAATSSLRFNCLLLQLALVRRRQPGMAHPGKGGFPGTFAKFGRETGPERGICPGAASVAAHGRDRPRPGPERRSDGPDATGSRAEPRSAHPIGATVSAWRIGRRCSNAP